jgi:hypothetical protein
MMRNRGQKGLSGIVGLQVLAIALGLFLFSANHAMGAGQILDDFITFQIATTTTTGAPGVTTDATPNTCYGNHRGFFVQKDGGGSGISVTDQTQTSVPFPHYFSFSIGSTGTGRGAIIYTGSSNLDPTTAGGRALNLNLLTGPDAATKFRLNVVQLDRPITLNVSVWKTDGTLTTAAYPISSTGFVLMAFTDFAGYSTIFNDIGAIKIDWAFDDVTVAFDMSFETFETLCDTPSPVVAKPTANPQVLPPGSTTTIAWNITLNGNPLSAQITNNCGATPSPYSIGTAIGNHDFVVPSLPCTFTVTEVGDCGEFSNFVTVTQELPPGKVPSLTEWGAIILSLILAVSAIVLLRRKNSTG